MCTVACTQDRSGFMAVITINLDDFLPKKLDGEVVTAEDWNKLVALFQAINTNALELLDLTKLVDINTANIATVTQGAVPDNSINGSKLSKLGGVTPVYQLTTDSTPSADVTYYIEDENGRYVAQTDLSSFLPEIKYYVLNTIDSTPAVDTPEHIADEVIQNKHLKANTLLSSVCSDLLLGGLLSDKATIYTNKGISGAFDLSTEKRGTLHTHDIVLDKPHKAVIILTTNAIAIITDYKAPAPDIYIGSEFKFTNEIAKQEHKFCVNTLIGDAKVNERPQKMTAYHGFYDEGYEDLYYASAPYELCGTRMVGLYRAYYDSSAKTIHCTFEQGYGRGASAPNSATKYDYSFGNIIIGL